MVLEVLKTTPNIAHLTDIFNNICDKNFRQYSQYTLRKKCPYTGVILVHIVSLYSVRMRENMDQNNSKYGLFSRSDNWHLKANRNPDKKNI